MSTDLLRTQPNERVDYSDFSYMLDESLTGVMRDAADNFLLDSGGATARRMCIIDGFEMSNPAAKQLVVTRGRALLAERIGTSVEYGAITTKGEATQTIDMAPLGANTYNVYIRFEYVDAESGSRVFWNPSGSGSEFTQNIQTRRQANWSIRTELSSPGAEWLKIGTADNTGGSLVLVDQRELYFEGPVVSSYQSGWSSEGGGIANDRNADRSQYGVKDLRTFADAMRQCVEDIKGRGLRRWYSKGIGGLSVGFDTDPTEKSVFVGDTTFGLAWFDANDVRLYGHTDDYMRYDRDEGSYGEWQWWVNNALQATLDETGIHVAAGLHVGATTGTITPDDVRVDGDVFAAGGIAAGTTTDPANGDGIFARGVVVGDVSAPADDELRVGDTVFGLHWVTSTDVLLRFDNNDQIRYDRTNDWMLFKINAVDEMILRSTGLSIENGLYVGSNSGTPLDNDIIAEGNIFSSVGYFLRDGNNFILINNGTGIDLFVNGAGSPEYSFTATAASFGGNNLTTVQDIDGAGDLTMGSITMTGFAIDSAGNMTNVGNISGAGSIDGSGDLTMGSITMVGFAVDSSGNITDVGNIAGAGNIDGSGDLTMGSITMTGFAIDSSGNMTNVGNIAGAGNIDGSGDLTMNSITMVGFSVDGAGAAIAASLGITGGPSLTSAGISNAKAISGATSIDGSGDLTMGSITMTGFSVDADGDLQAKTVYATKDASGIGDAIIVGFDDAGLGWDANDQVVLWWDMSASTVWEWDDGSNLWRFRIGGTEEYLFTTTRFDLKGNEIYGASSVGCTSVSCSGTVGCVDLNASNDVGCVDVNASGNISCNAIDVATDKVRTSQASGSIAATTTHVGLGLTVSADDVTTGSLIHCVIMGYVNTSGCTGTPTLDIAWDDDNTGGFTGSQICPLTLPISSYVAFVLEAWLTWYSPTSVMRFGRTFEENGGAFCQDGAGGGIPAGKLGEFGLRGDSGTGASYSYTITQAFIERVA